MSSVALEKPKSPGVEGSQDSKRPKDAECKRGNERRSKKKVNSNKKCKICGDNSYPNYFFCPSCHHRIEVYEEGDE
jgi:uncharacterized OB-fold protein